MTRLLLASQAGMLFTIKTRKKFVTFFIGGFRIFVNFGKLTLSNITIARLSEQTIA